MLKELSLRAFRFLQDWQLPAGYERSCKLSPRSISANRYLLGLDLSALSTAMLDDLVKRLEMPAELVKQLLTELPEASQLLIGFDGDSNKPTFKVYLEYWERLRSRRADLLNNDQALRLHLGFKWRCLSPTEFITTEYIWQPLIKQQQVRDAIDELYTQHRSSTVFAAIGDILNRAYRGNEAAEFIYLQVTEQSTVRKSFDLNLYPAGLKVSDIATPLHAVAASMQVSEDHLAKILSLHADQPLGHISAGFGSRGEEYFTFYFETEPD